MALDTMRQLPFTFRPTAIALALAALAAGSQCALADPSGPTVRSGAATVTGVGTGAVTVNASTASTLIQWQSFQVGAGQSVNFVLPSASSRVLNQIIGNAGFQGTVTPSAQLMFMQNGMVSGGGIPNMELGNTTLAALKLNPSMSGLSRGEERRDGLVREIVARLAAGQVVALAPAKGDASTTLSGDVVVAAGRSIELAEVNNPNLRVLIRAPEGRSLNVSELLSRARSTGVFGAMLAQPKLTRRADGEALQQLAGMREGHDLMDTLIAYLDDSAGRIAHIADPASDLLPTTVASAVLKTTEQPVQVASLAPAMPSLPALPRVPEAPAAAVEVPVAALAVVQEVELMESLVTSWQLAMAAPEPADTELMESRVTSWQLAAAPVPATVAGVLAVDTDVQPPVFEKPVQLAVVGAGEAPRIILPERRTAPVKLLRIEFRGGSFFM